MSTIVIPGVKKLSPAAKLSLVGAFWDEIAATAPEAIRLTAAQKEELGHRMEEFEKTPTEGSPWLLVKQRILRRSWRVV